MRRTLQLTVPIVLVLLSLVLGACQPVRPLAELPAGTAAPRRVSGEVYMAVPEWGDINLVDMFDFHEVDPKTHAAQGYWNWRIYSPTPQAPDQKSGWRGLDSDVKYVIFGKDIPGADPATVVVITQITRQQGWGYGAAGDYAYYWLRDSGQPDGAGDQWGMRYYKLDPWTEFYPANDPPPVAYFDVKAMQADDPVLPITSNMGDIKIAQ